MRCANWADVLIAKVEEWRARPFVYGSEDCLQFPADVVLALTGIDYRDRFPQYASQEEAEAILAAHGGMVGLISSVLGEPKHISRAMRGDVLAGEFGAGVTAAICLGANCCAVGMGGLVFRRTAEMQAAWSI